MFAKINSIIYNDIILNETFVNDNILEKRITLKFDNYQTMKNEFLKITSIEENINIQVFDLTENLIDEFQGLKNNFVISNNSKDNTYEIYLSLLVSMEGVSLWG